MSEIIDAIILNIVKALAKEGLRGTYYSLIGEVVRSRLGSSSSRKISAEDIAVISQILAQQIRAQTNQQISEEKLREIIREEIRRTLKNK